MNLNLDGAISAYRATIADFETGKDTIDLTAFTSQNRYFAVSGIIYPRLTPFAWATPPALALAFSLLASIWPAIMVARRRTAEILRIA